MSKKTNRRKPDTSRSFMSILPASTRLPVIIALIVICIAFGQLLARRFDYSAYTGFGPDYQANIPAANQPVHTYLTGSFLQFSPPVDRSTGEQLAADVRAMHAIGMDTVIYQVSVDWLGTPQTITETLAWYPSRIYPRAAILPAKDSLGTILDQAQALNMKVIVGLGYNQHFENPANLRSPAYLDHAAQQAMATAGELWTLYGDHPAFGGWYLPNEIGDFSWTTQEEGDLLATHYLAPVAQYCRKLSKPDMRVAIAPYFAKVLSPAQFEAWWTHLLGQAGVDTIILQDGIGTGRIQLDDLPAYFSAMQRACRTNNVELWAYVELFQQTHGWPIDGEPWAAESASIERVQMQLAIEQNYATKLIGQDLPRFMSPDRPGSPYAPKAAELYAAYRRLVNAGK